MKKLKQFYKNNEKTLLLCTGVLIGSLTTTYFASLALDGMELADANLYEVVETGQKFLHVTFANGAVRDYVWQAAEVAA